MRKLPRGTEIFYSKKSGITYLVSPGGKVRFITKDGHAGETILIGRNTTMSGQGYETAEPITVRGRARRKLAEQLGS